MNVNPRVAALIEVIDKIPAFLNVKSNIILIT
jgi:hypothetical protein